MHSPRELTFNRHHTTTLHTRNTTHTYLPVHPDIRAEAKAYFKVVQAIHHQGRTKLALETHTLPPGMQRLVRRTATAIKPSSPTPQLTQHILEYTTQYMLNICQILHTHYQDIIDSAQPHTQSNNNIPLHIAGAWAEKRYNQHLTHSTKDRVNTMEVALQIDTAHYNTPTPTHTDRDPHTGRTESPAHTNTESCIWTPESLAYNDMTPNAWIRDSHISTPTPRPPTPPPFNHLKPQSMGHKGTHTQSQSLLMSTGDASGRVHSKTGQSFRVKTPMMTRPDKGKTPKQVYSEPSPSTAGGLSSLGSPQSYGAPPPPTHTRRHTRSRARAHTTQTQHILTNMSTQTCTLVHTDATQTDIQRPPHTGCTQNTQTNTSTQTHTVIHTHATQTVPLRPPTANRLIQTRARVRLHSRPHPDSSSPTPASLP